MAHSEIIAAILFMIFVSGVVCAIGVVVSEKIIIPVIDAIDRRRARKHDVNKSNDVRFYIDEKSKQL